jgi:hypothetical protein
MELLLLHTWLSDPPRACAGVVGILLILWSVWPLVQKPVSRTLFGFVDDMATAWIHSGRHAIAGLLGFGLFLWSAWPIATMP